MKKTLLFFCFPLLSYLAFSQPITGRFGAPKTATGIYNLVADSSFALPYTLTFSPTRPGTLRYHLADSTIEVFTGATWKKVKGEGGVESPTLQANSLLGRNMEGTGAGKPIYTDPGGSVQIVGDSIKSFISYSARAKAITGAGDKTSSLNTQFTNGANLVQLDEAQTYTVGSVLNAQGKRLKFENGAKLTGGGTLRNVTIDAPDNQQIFDTTVKVIGLQRASVAWWGAKRTATNSRFQRKAIQAAIDAMAPGGTLVIPADSVLGNSVYSLDSTITIRNDIRIIGEGSILNPQSVLFFPPNTLGINIEATGAKRVHIKDISIQQATASVWDTTKHGIQSNTFTYLDNIRFFNIAGDGVHIVANPPLTNADHSRIENCYFNNTHNGIYFDGADVNIVNLNNNDFTHVRRWGYYSNGFLGNIQINNHFAECGKTNETLVNYGGFTWAARNLVGIQNKGNRPDLSPFMWEKCNFTLPGFDAWDTTKYYYSGGPYAVTNLNARELVLNPYTESLQPRSMLSSRSIRIGGLAEDGGPTNGGSIDVEGSVMLLGKDVGVKGQLAVNERVIADKFKSAPGGGFFVSDGSFNEYNAGITGYNGRLELWNNLTSAAYFDNADNTMFLVPVLNANDSTKRAATTGWVRRTFVSLSSGNLKWTDTTSYIATNHYVDSSIVANREFSEATVTTNSGTTTTLATIYCSTNYTVYSIEFTITAYNETLDEFVTKKYICAIKNNSGTLVASLSAAFASAGDDATWTGVVSLVPTGTNCAIRVTPANANNTIWTIKYSKPSQATYIP